MELQKIADELLWPCWRGMPDGYKMRYARNIWDQFSDAIRAAAYTPSLPRFFDQFSQRLNITVRADDIPLVNAILTALDDRGILRSLREETTTLVLMVRLRNQERKEKLEAERKGRDLLEGL